MGKRYHCDFCDKSFAYSVQNRKKHDQGIHHQRNRKLHYDSFRDPAELLAEDATKPPCRRFFQTGSCAFGVNCRYSHTNPQMVLAAQAEKQKSQAQEPTLDDWLLKWRKRRKTDQDNDKSTADTTMPPGLPPEYLLPPSIRPPPPGGYASPIIEWG